MSRLALDQLNFCGMATNFVFCVTTNAVFLNLGSTEPRGFASSLKRSLKIL